MIDFFLHWFNSLSDTDPALKMKVLKNNIEIRSLYSASDSQTLRKMLLENNMTWPSESQINTMISEMADDGFKRKSEQSYKLIESGRIKALSYFDEAYPGKLKDIYDPPIILYFQGELPNKGILTTAVVGSRHPSKDGLEMAYRFSERLSLAGVQVVSGMAIGIDTMAHRACVDKGRKTYAVLGSGVDVPYPMSNLELYEKIIECGGVISEFIPGDKPVPRHFPRRNRIISGLADKVVLIEAGEHSGSLITADFALEQGKDIYAVPGRPGDELSKGCNELIKKGGAGLITDVSDII